MRRSRGFVLTEILLVLLIVCVMAGALCLRPAVGGETRAVKEEADSLAMWLSDRMTRARLEGVGFKLYLSKSAAASETVEIMLARGDAEKGGKHEVYRAGRTVTLKARNLREHVYDSVWHTLTPAMTIYVGPRQRTDEANCAVTVSGQGFVSVAEAGSSREAAK